MLISLYVDDLLNACNDLNALIWFMKAFCNKFDVTDCGESRFFLGFEIFESHESKTLHLSPTRYIEKVLESFDMKDS